VPKGDQDHGRIAVTVPITFGSLDQLLDLSFGQVFTGAILGVGTSAWSNCLFYVGWRH
jgi:hypothetical protein